ncbi:MAG: DUF4065 domain-containing protein [Muribaculaceae bacterium]|nr:DUF4065 domain-containing protein [Muribaculaceae bacterium]
MDILNIAIYIVSLYLKKYGVIIDEMKLHKLLYFSQREYMVEYGEAMFQDEFEAWKYGPVMTIVRAIYPTIANPNITVHPVPSRISTVIEKVFDLYSRKRSWNLSSLTHNEMSWQHAREGIPPSATIGRKMLTSDIIEDANRVRLRRYLYS